MTEVKESDVLSGLTDDQRRPSLQPLGRGFDLHRADRRRSVFPDEATLKTVQTWTYPSFAIPIKLGAE